VVAFNRHLEETHILRTELTHLISAFIINADDVHRGFGVLGFWGFGETIADVVVILGRVDIVLGEVDR